MSRVASLAIAFGLGLLMFSSSLPASAAPPFTFKVEYHRYHVATLGAAGLEGPCDSPALGAVVFCETVQLEEPPNKFHVAIRDDVPAVVGGHWEFRSQDGSVLWEGSFCKEANDGPLPLNATHFVVRVDLHSPLCPSPGTYAGWVIVTWRWTPETVVTPPSEEEECPPCPCEEDP
jgi:hypothetical protein